MPQWLQWFLKVAIPLVAVIIAGCALWLTISQANEQRDHNRKSVLPAICPFALSGPDPDGTEAGIYLLNAGIGPAQLLGVRVLHNGTPMTSAMELRGLIEEQWCSSHPTSDLEFRWRVWGIEFDKVIRAAMLPAGKNIHILALRDEYWTPEFGTFFRSFLLSIEVWVKWASIYGDEDEIHWAP